MNDTTTLGAYLAAAAELLHRLPRGRDDVRLAQQMVAAWRESHPHIPLQHLVNRTPGLEVVDHDLLIDDPTGGRLALTHAPDDGTPWAIETADHWASNLVLSLDEDYSISVQQALLQMRLQMRRTPGLMDHMIDHLILAREAVSLDLPDTSALQQAADDFRRSMGLLSASDTQRWLDEIHLPAVYFESMLELAVKIGRVKQRVADDGRAQYFESHRHDFDRVRYVRAWCVEREELSHLTRESGLLAGLSAVPGRESSRVEYIVNTGFAGALPLPARNTPLGAPTGSFPSGGGWEIFQLLARWPAELDDETRRAVDEAVCRQWLAQQRAVNRIRWHWF